MDPRARSETRSRRGRKRSAKELAQVDEKKGVNSKGESGSEEDGAREKGSAAKGCKTSEKEH